MTKPPRRPALRAAVSLANASAIAAVLMVALGACTAMTPAANVLDSKNIAAIVASPDRSAADKNMDARRKPAQLLAFIGARPGMNALDLSAGGGYTTELLARAIGPTGRVYGQSQPPRAPGSAPLAPVAPEGDAAPAPASQVAAPVSTPPVRRTSAQALAERAKNPAVANIVPVVQPFENPAPAAVAVASLDLVTLIFNYHDLGHMGVDRARMNQAVFAALKPGGMYVLADHAGRPGTGISEGGTLHRIDEAFLRQEVEAAGFKLAGQGDFYRNPADPRDKNTPEAGQAKDQFVFKFVKP